MALDLLKYKAMSNYLIEAILLHHNKQVRTVGGLLYTGKAYYNLKDNTNDIEWLDVTGYSLKQLKDYLNL